MSNGLSRESPFVFVFVFLNDVLLLLAASLAALSIYSFCFVFLFFDLIFKGHVCGEKSLFREDLLAFTKEQIRRTSPHSS